VAVDVCEVDVYGDGVVVAPHVGECDVDVTGGLESLVVRTSDADWLSNTVTEITRQATRVCTRAGARKVAMRDGDFRPP
jgi:hypothetical protein